MSTLPDVGAELTIEVERVADRLRSLSQARLEGSRTGQDPPAAAAHASAARLVAAARALGDGGAPDSSGVVPGGGPPLPVLSAFAVGDQVAVTGHDLLAAAARSSARAAAASDVRPVGAALARVQAVLQDALEDLRALRRSL